MPSGLAIRRVRLVASLFGCGLLFTFPQLVAARTFTTFDCPGAVAIVPAGINRAGVITGYCNFKSVPSNRGFLRKPDGSIMTFIISNASSTLPYAINDNGDIVGSYDDSNGGLHGFIRSSSGTITTFDGPGATVTQPFDINSSGFIAGYYGGNPGHGFVRDPQGNITTIDAATGVTTVASGINSSGQIAGYYNDSVGYHAFVRDASGNITAFEAPGNGIDRTFALAINTAGEVTGGYSSPGNFEQGYVRDWLGNFSTFSVPNATQATVPLDVNDAGAVVGYAEGTTFTGFVRNASGTVSVFEAPGSGRGNLQGTLALRINRKGTITGYYIDGAGVYHGFLVQ